MQLFYASWSDLRHTVFTSTLNGTNPNLLFIWGMKRFRLTHVWLGEGNGTPLQQACLANPMDGGAWWAAVRGVDKSRTRLSDFTFTFHFHALEKEMAIHLCSCLENLRDGGAWWAAILGSHRVGHYWSDLEAAAAAACVTNYVYGLLTSKPYMLLLLRPLFSSLTLRQKTCDLLEVWWIYLETHTGERYESENFKWPLQL